MKTLLNAIFIIVLTLGCDPTTNNEETVEAQSRTGISNTEAEGDYFIPYRQPLPETDNSMGGLGAGDDDNEITCSEGYTDCANSGSGAFSCCAANESCNTERGAAVCRPKDQSACAGTDSPQYCAGSSSNSCCPSDASCDSLFGHAFCTYDEDVCPTGTEPCGSYKTACCPKDDCEKLDFFGKFGACDYDEDQCPEGETHCAGDRFSSCCPVGTVCSPGTGEDGSPNCIPIGRTECEDGSTLSNGECAPISNDGGVAEPIAEVDGGQQQVVEH